MQCETHTASRKLRESVRTGQEREENEEREEGNDNETVDTNSQSEKVPLTQE
jgi:hypothetical protein